jgi:hypothetical protein
MDAIRPFFLSLLIVTDWRRTPTLTMWTCRLVVSPYRAHGVALEASVSIRYLLGRMSIVFSLLSLQLYVVFLSLTENGINLIDSQACH